MTWGWNVPSPLPSSTDTCVGAESLATARSVPAVAGEVARHDGVGVDPHRVGDLGLEGAVAVAQQAPTRCHVGSPTLATARSSAAVAGEVARHDRVWDRPHRVGRPAGWKVPSPLPSSTDTCVGRRVCDGQVECGRRR